jgi:hypothetical protein
LAAANAWTVGGHTITSESGSVISLVLKAASSPTARIFETRNSSGTAGTGISPDGTLFSAKYAYIGAVANTGISNTYFSVVSQAAASIPMAVRGAASQTANLQEWQNSAGVVSAKANLSGLFADNVGSANALAQLQERSAGGVLTITRATSAVANPGANIGRLYFRDGTTTGTLKLVVRAGAAGAETTILDNIPQ